MSESKTNIGWLLCPSRSSPGKYYYYNVQTRKAAWTLDETDNNLSVLTITEPPHAFSKPKMLLEDKSDGYPEPTTVPEDKSYGYPKPNTLPENKSHGYPEPTTLPDRTTITPNYIYTYTKKLDIFLNVPWTQQPPTVAQTTFPTYVMNSTLPNFVRTNKNVKTPFLCLDGRQKTVDPFAKFETSTPNNIFLERISDSQSFHPESLIKEPVLKSEPTPVWKLEPKLPTPKIPDAFLSSKDEVMKMVQTTHPKDWTSEIIFDSESNSPVPLIKEPASISEPTPVLKLHPKLPTPNPDVFMSNEKRIISASQKFETSTLINHLFLESISESQSFHPESLIKEPVLKSEPTPVWKLDPKLPTPKIPDAFLSSEDEIMKMVQTTHPKDWTSEIIFDSESNSPEPLIKEPASISKPTLVWKLQPKLPTPNPDVFMSNAKRIIGASQKFETSTSNNSFLESISESQSNNPEPLIVEPVSISEPTPVWKVQPKLPTPYIHDAFLSNGKPIITQSNKFKTYNSKNCVSEYVLESQSFGPESLIKETVLKSEPKPVWKLEPKLSENPIISLGSRVGRMKSTKEFPESKRIHILQDIDLTSTDLRFRLLAKRKFKDVTDTAAKRPFIQNNRVPVQRFQDALHTSRDVIAPSVAQRFATAPRNSVEPFTWTGIVPDMPYKNDPKC